jgi:hypothetical protein
MAIFLEFTVCLELALNSLLWGPQAAFCKLKSVTDLHLGSARFPVTVTSLWGGAAGVEGKLCTSLFLCNWLVFLTTCEPSTAKPPWLHKPPGGYITHPLTQINAQGFEKLSPESTSIIKFLIPAKWSWWLCFPRRFLQQYNLFYLRDSA